MIRGRFVHGKVADIEANTVTLQDGSHYDFDYLVIASGSSYTPPIKVSADDNKKGKILDIDESSASNDHVNHHTLQSRRRDLLE